MAKEQDHSKIGFSKSTMTFISLVIALIYFGIFFKDRGGTEAKAEAISNAAVQSNTYRNDLQDKKIADNSNGVSEVRENQHAQEVLQAVLLEKATKTESDMSDIKQYIMQYDFGPKKGND